jgi:formate-dependent nitrite reductase membrane component NrfD
VVLFRMVPLVFNAITYSISSITQDSFRISTYMIFLILYLSIILHNYSVSRCLTHNHSYFPFLLFVIR